MARSRVSVAAFLLLIVFATVVDGPTTIANTIAGKDAQQQKLDAIAGQGSVPWYKGVKDALLAVAVLPLLVGMTMRGTPTFRLPASFMNVATAVVGALGIASVIATLRYGVLVALLGVRSFTPVFAVLIGATLTVRDLHRVFLLMLNLLVVETVLTAWQIHAGVTWLGSGWGYRVTGTFFEPNTLALFAVATLLVVPVARSSHLSVLLAVAVSGLVVLGSGSRAGIVLVAVWLGIAALQRVRNKNLRALVMTYVPPSFVASVVLAQTLAGRGNIFVVSDDALGRFGIMVWAFRNASALEVIVGRGLGIGSNLLVSLAPLINFQALGVPLVVDSLITAAFVQGGVLLVLTLGCFFLWPLGRRCTRDDLSWLRVLLPCITILAAFGSVTIEAAPFNYVVFALYGYLARAGAAEDETRFQSRDLVLGRQGGPARSGPRGRVQKPKDVNALGSPT